MADCGEGKSLSRPRATNYHSDFLQSMKFLPHHVLYRSGHRGLRKRLNSDASPHDLENMQSIPSTWLHQFPSGKTDYVAQRDGRLLS